MASFQPNSNGEPVAAEPWLPTIFSRDHKSVGLLYLWLALISVVLGMALSLVMRVQLGHQGASVAGSTGSSERYAAITLLHGSLMVFFVLTAAPQCGFGYFFVPLQIGAREMAFPRLSALSFWMTATSLAGILASSRLNSNFGMTVWLLSVSCFCVAMI